MNSDIKPSKNTVDLIMWLLVGALAGAGLGFYMSLGVKQLIFFVILGIGAAALINLNRSKNESKPKLNVEEKPARSAVEEIAIPPVSNVPSEPRMPETSIEALVSDSDRILTKEESRQWLDDFLVKQQKLK